jgi:hypothetical protein
MYTLMEAYQHSVKQVAKLLSVADTFLWACAGSDKDW